LCWPKRLSIILDDLAGRLEAAARGLRVIGPMGILLRAKTERQISTVAEILSELDSALDVHVSAAVRAETLRLAGES
jgi:predicted nucleic acid-binding protein